MMGKTGWSLLVLAAFLGLLWVRTHPEPMLPTAQFTPPTIQYVPTTVPKALELPHVIRGTNLIIEKTVCYEGDFWEDGSDAHAVDIMALVVCNPGTEGIRSAEISVRQGSRQLCFVITCLPPGSRVLVLEKLRNAYSPEPLTECQCVTLEPGWESADAVRVEPAGLRELTVTNASQQDLQAVTLHYKRYSPDAGMYLGGITYQHTLQSLAAGECLRISPRRYVENAYHIVLVESQ